MKVIGMVVSAIGVFANVLSYIARTSAVVFLLRDALRSSLVIDASLGLAGLLSLLLITVNGVGMSRRIVEHRRFPHFDEEDATRLRRKFEAEGVSTTTPTRCVIFTVFALIAWVLVTRHDLFWAAAAVFLSQCATEVVGYLRRREEDARFPVSR